MRKASRNQKYSANFLHCHFNLNDSIIELLYRKLVFYMAITHKKNDQLEKMMANFAHIPSFDKPLEVDRDGKIIDQKSNQESQN